MDESPRPDRLRAPEPRGSEPMGRPLRIACGALGALLVAAALAAAAGEPNPWLALPPMGIGALLLMPVLGASGGRVGAEEAERALALASECTAAGWALLGPGLLGLVAARLLESSLPHFALADDVVGAIAAALIAVLLAGGAGCVLAAAYYRARALAG